MAYGMVRTPVICLPSRATPRSAALRKVFLTVDDGCWDSCTWSVMPSMSPELGVTPTLRRLFPVRNPSKGLSVAPTNVNVAAVLQKPSLAPAASVTSHVPHILASLAQLCPCHMCHLCVPWTCLHTQASPHIPCFCLVWVLGFGFFGQCPPLSSAWRTPIHT